MAWNQYYIMVDNQPNPDIDRILNSLGMSNYKKAGKYNLWETNKPDSLFVSHYNNSLIFAHPDIPFEFFRENKSDIEKKFINIFPNSRIAALIINETSSLFGFAIIEDGVKKRMKDGSGGEYYNDYGTPLPEEEESYKDFSEMLEEDEREEIIEECGEDGLEEYIQSQAAWGVPNMLSKYFLGDYVCAIDGEKIEFTKYEPNK